MIVPTITEQARRAQLTAATVEVVARHGYAGASLSRIAEAAGISKAAVLYHFPSRDAVVQAAYASVLDGMVGYVGAAVDAAPDGTALTAYIRSLIAYFDAHPAHARMIVETIGGDTGTTDSPASTSRRDDVAGLVRAAGVPGDPATVAVIVNGAIDGIVAERLADPSFDTAAAAQTLIDLVVPAPRD